MIRAASRPPRDGDTGRPEDGDGLDSHFPEGQFCRERPPAMGVIREHPLRRRTAGFRGDSPRFVKLGCSPSAVPADLMHPAVGGGARRQPPRWRPRTASSDNSAFRTCSPPSRRSLRSPPLRGASAWTPAPRVLRNGQLSDDAALHFPPRRGRCAAGASGAGRSHYAAPERDSTQRLESQPSHTLACGTATAKRRFRWTDRAHRKSRKTIMRRALCPERPRKPDGLLAQRVFLRHTCRAGSLRASGIPSGRTIAPAPAHVAATRTRCGSKQAPSRSIAQATLSSRSPTERRARACPWPRARSA